VRLIRVKNASGHWGREVEVIANGMVKAGPADDPLSTMCVLPSPSRTNSSLTHTSGYQDLITWSDIQPSPSFPVLAKFSPNPIHTTHQQI